MGYGVIMVPKAAFQTWLAVRRSRSCPEGSRPVIGSLRGEGNLRATNFSKAAVVAENILVTAQDGAHDERIIGVADLRNKIWDDVYFLGRITKGKRSFLS
jgi:hypothetical protein